MYIWAGAPPSTELVMPYSKRCHSHKQKYNCHFFDQNTAYHVRYMCIWLHTESCPPLSQHNYPYTAGLPRLTLYQGLRSKTQGWRAPGESYLWRFTRDLYTLSKDVCLYRCKIWNEDVTFPLCAFRTYTVCKTQVFVVPTCSFLATFLIVSQLFPFPL